MRGRKHGNPVDAKSSVTAVEPDLSAAHLALQRGDAPTAERVCREALAKNGSSAGALSLLAAILCRTQRSSEAFALLRAELEIRPRQPALQDVLATMLREFGFLDEAYKIRTQLVKWVPDEFKYVNELGLCLMAMNRFPEATQSFRTAIRLSPNTAVLHENLGLCLHRQGNFRPAIEALQRAVDLFRWRGPTPRWQSSTTK